MYFFSPAFFTNAFEQSLAAAQLEQGLTQLGAQEPQRTAFETLFGMYKLVMLAVLPKHRLSFSAQLCFSIHEQEGDFGPAALQFLSATRDAGTTTELNKCAAWLPDERWADANALAAAPGLAQFARLAHDPGIVHTTGGLVC